MDESDASEQPRRDGQPPRVFVSYSDDSLAHAKRVLELAQWLRSHGVDAQIDQFEESPEEGWPRWIYGQIRESEFVLIVATPGYLQRCESDEPRGDTPSATTKFGSYLTLQELHEAGGRNRKFVPVLFDGDAIVESVPLPLRGATCYRLPEQRDDLYRRLTGQPKVQRAPLGVLKTFDDETLDTGEELIIAADPPLRARTSLDEQHAEDSLRALVDAGITDEYEIPYERRGRGRSERRKWRFAFVAFAAAFLLVGLFMGQRLFVPEQDICHIQLTDEDGNVIKGIDHVDLTLPSGHLIEVIVQDGSTLRFACPEDRVQAQAHVYLAEAESEPPIPVPAEDVAMARDQPLEVHGRVALPASGEAAGFAVTQAQLVQVTPPRPILEPEPEPEPVGPEQPEPVKVGDGDGDGEPPVIKPPPKRLPKVKPISESPELQAKLEKELAQLRACYESGIASDPTLRGKITADVKTDATGQVVEFKLVSNGLRSNRKVTDCIGKEIESWKVYQATKNPRGTVDRISIDFTPPV